MEHDGYIAELRGILSQSPKKESWLQLRELWMSWPEEQLPDVISEYIVEVGLKDAWKRYLTRVGYKTPEEITEAPGVERQIRAWRDQIPPALTASCAKLAQLLIEHYQPPSEDMQVHSITPNVEGFIKAWNMEERRKFRRARLEQRVLVETVTLRSDDSFYIEFHNGQCLGSEHRGLYVRIRQKEPSLDNITVYCGWEEEEIMGWAENDLAPDWLCYAGEGWF